LNEEERARNEEKRTRYFRILVESVLGQEPVEQNDPYREYLALREQLAAERERNFRELVGGVIRQIPVTSGEHYREYLTRREFIGKQQQSPDDAPAEAPPRADRPNHTRTFIVSALLMMVAALVGVAIHGALHEQHWPAVEKMLCFVFGPVLALAGVATNYYFRSERRATATVRD
jgi:hypothetical protein